MKQPMSGISLKRRNFLAGAAGTAVLAGLNCSRPLALTGDTESELNLARVALPSSATLVSENKISALNDGFSPANSRDRENGFYAIRRGHESDSRTPWVQYDWSKPVAINKIDVYWAIDPPRPNAPPGSGFGRTAAPASYRILYWNGSDFLPVSSPQGLGVAADT